jgi:hypothetical protein
MMPSEERGGHSNSTIKSSVVGSFNLDLDQKNGSNWCQKFVGNSYRTKSMITLEDCIGLCGLTEQEVLAVAEHEHLPEVAATALAQYLLSHDQGSAVIRDMIVDDIRLAQSGGNKEHVLTLLHVLHHFLVTHPEARPAEHPWSSRY